MKNGERTVNTRQAVDSAKTAPPAEEEIASWLIRDLVDAYPVTMGVLAPLGIDLCCGGGHPLGEALDLHGLERETILPRIAQVIADSAVGEE
jgi:iron-sulfur cluster repair protein YtfE (RIC family)